MTLLTVNDALFTWSELIQIISFIITVLGVWYVFQLKFTKFKTSTDIKLVDIENDFDLKINSMAKERCLQIAGIQAEVNLKIEKMSEQTALKLQTIDSKARGIEQFITQRITESFEKNNEEHKQLMVEIRETNRNVMELYKTIKNSTKNEKLITEKR